MGRPLVGDVGNMGAADIALLEIIEEKIGFEMPELVELVRPAARNAAKALGPPQGDSSGSHRFGQGWFRECRTRGRGRSFTGIIPWPTF